MRLLALKSGPQILRFLKELESESKAITEDIVTIAVYSGQSYDQVWHLSSEEKDVFVKVLKDKISLDRGVKPKDVLVQGSV
jgi:hypothetical protein